MLSPQEAAKGFIMVKQFVRRRDPNVRDGDPLPVDQYPLVASLYDAGIGYTDDQLGHLFDAIERLDLNRSTIVVFLSDHGEALGEHG
jgi:arylsulfatase A-like enzyme